MDIGHCSCFAGKTGGPCKHQAAVLKYFPVSSSNFIPIDDPQGRLHLYKIATGKWHILRKNSILRWRQGDYLCNSTVHLDQLPCSHYQNRSTSSDPRRSKVVQYRGEQDGPTWERSQRGALQKTAIPNPTTSWGNWYGFGSLFRKRTMVVQCGLILLMRRHGMRPQEVFTQCSISYVHILPTYRLMYIQI